MNSPPDPGSPSTSTPSSGSPPPEELGTQPANSNSFINITSHITQSFTGGASKRRFPGGSGFGTSSSNRDSKTRRRGDPTRFTGNATSIDRVSSWEGSKAEMKREERELVDHSLVDFLRREIGDPFQDRDIKSYS